MRKKLMITISELEAAYAEMASDKKREEEALEWCEGFRRPLLIKSSRRYC